MGLVVRENGWSVNFTQFHGSNVVSCEVVTSGKRTTLIGAYIPNSTLDHLQDLEEALTRFRDHYPIVLEELNVNIVQSHNLHIQQVADLLMDFGLVEILLHSRQRWKFRHMKKCLQVISGRLLWTICNYILGTDMRRSEMAGIGDMHNYSSYNFALRAIILQRPMRYHGSYLRICRAFTLSIPMP